MSEHTDALLARKVEPARPLAFSYDAALDVLEVEGMKYSGQLLRLWSMKGLPVGTCFKIVQRENGVLWVEEVDPVAP
jgi:hypothetical protein